MHVKSPRIKTNKKVKSGFTLIELLVVISIIGFIATLVLASLHTTSIRGRDSRRLSDLLQVRNALELYLQDHGHYPSTACSGPHSSPDGWISPDSTFQAYMTYGTCDAENGPVTFAGINAALAAYIQPIKDPKRSMIDPVSGYWYKSNGTEFKFQIYYTPENMNNFPVQYIDPSACGLPILPNGDCSAAGNQASPFGGYYWVHEIAVWSSNFNVVYPNE
jgi:prepilin-type N-terminal cleavage/methylation domain-containing protein